MTPRTDSRLCPEHPAFLEALAEAEGRRLPLPDAAEGCALCAANLRRYALIQRALRASEAAPPPLLSPTWQAGVWLRLGREAADDADLPSPQDAPLPAGRVVAFPRPALASTSTPEALPPEASPFDAPRPPEPAEPAPSEAPRATPPPTPARWLRWAAAAAVLLACGGALAAALRPSEPAPPSPLATQWRGDHMVQPDNPPRPAAQILVAAQEAQPADAPATPRVSLKAYAMDALNEDDPASTLQDGSVIAPGALLSFDYAVEGDAINEELRYLTVVAIHQSQRAQEQAVPEGKQLLWLVESHPIRDTGGQLSVLDEEDVQVKAPPGEMTIFGIFSREPVPGRAIEDALLLHHAGPSALPDVGVARLNLKIEQ